MKLTLNVAEVQEAVTQHIVTSGFPEIGRAHV